MKFRSMSLVSKINQYPADADVVENRVNNLEFHLKHIKGQVIPLHLENGNLKNSYHELKFSIEDHLEQLLPYFTDKEQLLANTSDFEGFIQLVKSKLDSQVNALSVKIQQIDEQNNKIHQLEERLSNFDKELDHKLQQLKNSHVNELSIKDQEVHEAQMQVQRLQKDYNTKDKQLQSLNQNIQNYVSESLKDKLSIIHNLNEQILSLKEQHIQQIQIKEDEINKISFQLEKERKLLKDELSCLESKIETKYKTVFQESQSLQDTNSQLQKTNSQLRQQLALAEKQISSLKQQKQQSINELIQEKKSRSQDNKLLNETQDQIKSYKHEIEKLNRQIYRNNTQLDTYEQEKLRIQKEFGIEKSILQSKIDQLTNTLSELQNQVQISKKAFDEQLIIQRVKFMKLLGQEIQEQDFEMKDQAEQFDSPYLKSYIDGLEFQNTSLKNRQEELLKVQSSLKNELQLQKILLEKHLSDSIAELNHKHQLVIDQMIREFNNEKEDLHNKFKQDLFDNNQLNQNQIYELTQQLETISKKNSQMAIESSQLEQQIQELNTEQYQKQQMYQDLMSEIQFKADIQLKELSLKTENENLIRQQIIVQQNQQINDLQQKLKAQDLQRANQQQLLQSIAVEQRQDKQLIKIQQQELETKIKELAQQNQASVRQQERIKQLQLEVDNSKQVYNIFKKPQQTQIATIVQSQRLQTLDVFNFKKMQTERKPTKLSMQLPQTAEKRIRSVSSGKISLRTRSLFKE